jgi:hypothetical protein
MLHLGGASVRVLKTVSTRTFDLYALKLEPDFNTGTTLGAGMYKRTTELRCRNNLRNVILIGQISRKCGNAPAFAF